jgi:hypothetical protein
MQQKVQKRTRDAVEVWRFRSGPEVQQSTRGTAGVRGAAEDQRARSAVEAQCG